MDKKKSDGRAAVGFDGQRNASAFTIMGKVVVEPESMSTQELR